MLETSVFVTLWKDKISLVELICFKDLLSQVPKGACGRRKEASLSELSMNIANPKVLAFEKAGQSGWSSESFYLLIERADEKKSQDGILGVRCAPQRERFLAFLTHLSRTRITIPSVIPS
jgi:hypothetical protein